MFGNHISPRIAVLAGVLMAGVAMGSARAQNPPQPDNTKSNEQDRATGGVTADQQKNDRTDRQMTKQIRKAVVKDKSLSTDAHNIKIITQNGEVTLKGPVRSDDERKTIVGKAEQVAGSGKVNDQLSVVP